MLAALPATRAMTTTVAAQPTAEGEVHSDFAPAVYGSLLVTTLIAVQWQGAAIPERIGLSLVISVAVFWLAHAWAEIVDRRVHGPIGLAGGLRLAWSEASILTPALVPALILGLPRLTGLEVDTAIGLALVASLVQLFLWGLAVGRSAHGSWPLALGVAAIDGALGVAIVILKVVVIH